MIGSVVLFVLALVVFCTWGLNNLKVCLPLLFARRGRYAFTGGPEVVAQQEWSDETQGLIDALKRLEFEPLGVRVESRPFKTTKELSFASSEKQTFASIQGHEGDAPHYYFYTPYDDGAVVLTADVPMEQLRTDRFLHAGLAHQDMTAVLALHGKNVQKMTRPGRQPYAKYDQEARIRATRAYYDNPGSGIIVRTIMFNSLRNFGICLGILLLATAVMFWRWLPVILALKLS